MGSAGADASESAYEVDLGGCSAERAAAARGASMRHAAEVPYTITFEMAWKFEMNSVAMKALCEQDSEDFGCDVGVREGSAFKCSK